MKRAELRIPDHTAHILEAIGRIAQYTEGMDEAAFLRSKLVQDAVIRNIEASAKRPATSRGLPRRSLPTITTSLGAP